VAHDNCRDRQKGDHDRKAEPPQKSDGVGGGIAALEEKRKKTA
jgi:hypothetical protein